VVRDEDIAAQIGKDIYFDLVDYDKVKSFHVQKKTSFNVFKVSISSYITLLPQKIREKLSLVN
jgi:ubiquitin carboxyl-terminal hydrolase 7